jgi:hypothetical protein
MLQWASPTAPVEFAPAEQVWHAEASKWPLDTTVCVCALNRETTPPEEKSIADNDDI